MDSLIFSSLLTRRHALMPISILPPEFLKRVFHLLALEEPAFYGKQNLGLIRVAHVCQHSALFSVGVKSLWTIRRYGLESPTKISCILEVLARAMKSSLNIDIDLDAAPNSGVIWLFPEEDNE